MKKSFYPSIVFLFLFNASFSQTVVISDETDRVEGKEGPGVSTTLEIVNSREIEKFWANHLKSYGRMSIKNDFYTVSEARIPKIAGNSPARIFPLVVIPLKGVASSSASIFSDL